MDIEASINGTGTRNAVNTDATTEEVDEEPHHDAMADNSESSNDNDTRSDTATKVFRKAGI